MGDDDLGNARILSISANMAGWAAGCDNNATIPRVDLDAETGSSGWLNDVAMGSGGGAPRSCRREHSAMTTARRWTRSTALVVDRQPAAARAANSPRLWPDMRSV